MFFFLFRFGKMKFSAMLPHWKMFLATTRKNQPLATLEKILPKPMVLRL